MPIDFPTSPSVGQQYQYGGTVYTFTAQGVWSPIGAIAGVGPPQGRLTIQSLTPVISSTISSASIIYYTPYIGNLIPIYNGSAFVMTAFSELSCTLTDTTKNPSAIGASKVNDWFVWSDAGTLRVSHGPDWTSDTARSAGTALVRVNGIWLNNASITNACAAQRGTYVGTTRSNSSSVLMFVYGAAGVGGFFCLWNCYNRVRTVSSVPETTATWSYGSTTYRARNNNLNNYNAFVMGLAEDSIELFNHAYGPTDSAGNLPVTGIGIDTTTVPSGIQSQPVNGANAQGTMLAHWHGSLLGYHITYAIEAANNSGTPTWYGFFAGPPSRAFASYDMSVML